MEILKGIAVSPGVAISTAYVLGRERYAIPTRAVDPADFEAEVVRFRAAVVKAAEELEALKDRLRSTLADRYVAILDAHRAMLTDERLSQDVIGRVRDERVTAERAVVLVLAEYARTLEAVEDPYISQRAGDIFDIQQRLLGALMGRRAAGMSDITEPVVIVAHELTPTETLAIDRARVVGLATDGGGSASHTSIVARALSIPAVVGLGRASAAVVAGDTVVIDGDKGLLVVNPDSATLERYRAAQKPAAAAPAGLLRDLPAVTVDGRAVRLMGNIEVPEEISSALANGADGIGLFRTEFLFLRAGHEPSEEEQFFAYLQAARMLGGKPLVIRTFDLGGEKLAVGVKHYVERNPSLGCRSIRFSMENPAMFRAQLRAILRASAHGNIRLLFPMISSVEELKRAKAFVDEARKELAARGVPVAEKIPTGIMVEVPSVAVAPDAFAAQVDFFSVGTNDLIQYTLAVERVNEHVAWLFNPAHPAILRLLKNIVEAAARARIPVSICGEMAGDPVFTMFLTGVGFEELSMTPPAIPRVKRTLRSISYKDAKAAADRALQLENAREVTAFLMESVTAAAKPPLR